MKDLKILWLGRNDTYKMDSATRTFREALAKQASVSIYGMGWGHPDIPNANPYRSKENDMVKLVKIFKPDYIYIDHYKDWFNIDKVSVPSSFWVCDLHGRVGENIDFMVKNKITVCLSPCQGIYAGWGLQRYREALPESIRVKQLPFAVDVDLFKDRGYERDVDLCLLGRRAHSLYPLRTEIFNHYRDGKQYKIFHTERPKRGWDLTEAKMKEMGVVARESYAEILSRCKMYPFDCSIYKYSQPRFLECMASKTLALSDLPSDAETLHYLPDETLVEINLGDYKEKIDYFYEHEDERKKIIENAYKMAHFYHTTKIRAKELLKYIEDELL